MEKFDKSSHKIFKLVKHVKPIFPVHIYIYVFILSIYKSNKIQSFKENNEKKKSLLYGIK